jgi:hypothetical protein
MNPETWSLDPKRQILNSLPYSLNYKHQPLITEA